jgi:hypothetical protein
MTTNPSHLASATEDPPKASLLRFPPELLSHIASNLDLPSLTLLSLVSREIWAAAQPHLYNEVALGWAIGVDEDGVVDVEGLEQLKAVVRRAVESLAQDRQRCHFIRQLRILEYGWMGEKEMNGLAKIVDQSRIEVLQMVSWFPEWHAPSSSSCFFAGSQSKHGDGRLRAFPRTSLGRRQPSAPAAHPRLFSGTHYGAQAARVPGVNSSRLDRLWHR